MSLVNTGQLLVRKSTEEQAADLLLGKELLIRRSRVSKSDCAT